jgi:transposase
MSLPAMDSQPTLFGSIPSIARELFSEDDRYRLFAQKVWPVLCGTRAALEECYCQDNGRPGIEPVLLMGVLVLQFLERLPDRQALEMVKYHLGWKLALNLELEQKGFHPTVLCYFRQRLVEQDQAGAAFGAVLEALQEEGLVPKKTRQRLDSTHVIGLVAGLSTLDCIRETMRLALEELAQALPERERPDFWPLLWERYVENKLDYKSAEAVLRSKQKQAGEDICLLLKWLEPLTVEAREGRQVALLRKVFEENYTLDETGHCEPVKMRGSGTVQTPHEPEAQYCVKGQGKARKSWVGYKVQVAESIGEEGGGNFLTSIVTQEATGSDDAGLPATLERQKQMGLETPSELYVDGAYISAEALVQAEKENRELMGPAQPSAHKENVFGAEKFDVKVEQRRAFCPAGKESTQCSRLEEKQSGKVSYRFEWSWQCHGCQWRERCVGANQKHRTLVVGQHHTLLQKRRREQHTSLFLDRMKIRNGIEGTQSELVRAHGLRRARYRGKAKVDLQNQFIGAACNIKRWLRLLTQQMKPKAPQNSPPTGCARARIGILRIINALRAAFYPKPCVSCHEQSLSLASSLLGCLAQPSTWLRKTESFSAESLVTGHLFSYFRRTPPAPRSDISRHP